jgi:hypothetical protein
MVKPLNVKPTREAYGELDACYAFFNERLFKGRLPGAILTFRRNRRSRGFFSPRRFVNGNGVIVDEIALNPEYFLIRPVESILSTLAHEQAHQDIFHHDPKNAGSKYHSRAWADLMIAIGLHPSDTGMPGGRETGEKVSHYIVDGGPFIKAVREWLETSAGISWFDRFPVAATTEVDYVGLSPAAIERGVLPSNGRDIELIISGRSGGDDGSLSSPSIVPAAPAALAISRNDLHGGSQSGVASPIVHVSVPAPLTVGPLPAPTMGGPRTPVLSVNASDRLITTKRSGTQSVPVRQVKIDPQAGLPPRHRETRSCFMCPRCGDRAWGRPSLKLICGKCRVAFVWNGGLPETREDEARDDA